MYKILSSNYEPITLSGWLYEFYLILFFNTFPCFLCVFFLFRPITFVRLALCVFLILFFNNFPCSLCVFFQFLFYLFPAIESRDAQGRISGTRPAGPAKELRGDVLRVHFEKNERVAWYHLPLFLLSIFFIVIRF
jgi:hypothetical protein